MLCDCVSTHAEQQDLAWSYFRMEMVPVLVALSKGRIPLTSGQNILYVTYIFFSIHTKDIMYIYIRYTYTPTHFYVNQASKDDTLQGFD